MAARMNALRLKRVWVDGKKNHIKYLPWKVSCRKVEKSRKTWLGDNEIWRGARNPSSTRPARFSLCLRDAFHEGGNIFVSVQVAWIYYAVVCHFYRRFSSSRVVATNNAKWKHFLRNSNESSTVWDYIIGDLQKFHCLRLRCRWFTEIINIYQWLWTLSTFVHTSHILHCLTSCPGITWKRYWSFSSQNLQYFLSFKYIQV